MITEKPIFIFVSYWIGGYDLMMQRQLVNPKKTSFVVTAFHSSLLLLLPPHWRL